MLVQADSSVCRCAGLREQFGDGAPVRCGQCELVARVAELEAGGYVESDIGWRLAFEDCGVPVETTRDRRIFVPRWAQEVAESLFNTHTLGPVLTRAAADPTFRAALLTLLTREYRLWDSSDAATRDSIAKAAERSVAAFARTQGVTLPPGAT